MSNFSYFDFIKRHPFWINCSLVIVSTVLTFLLCEGLFRIYLSQCNPPFAEETQKMARIVGNDLYTPQFKSHPFLSYGRTDTLLTSTGIQIGTEFYTREKEAGVVRIACLGGSTTMKAYPRQLEFYLNLLPYPAKFEVMDFGCIGWTSMESLINYLTRVSYFKPDIVIIHHGINDSPALHWDNFKADYSHYRLTWQEKEIGNLERLFLGHSWLFSYCLLRLGQSPLDLGHHVIREIDPSHYLPQMNSEGLQVYGNTIRKMAALIRADGGTVIVAPMAYNRHLGQVDKNRLIEQCNKTARGVAQEMGIPLTETDALLRDHPECFRDLVHLTDAGKFAKAQSFTQVIQYLLSQGKKETVPQRFEPNWDAGRDVELSWECTEEPVLDYHIQMQLNRDKKWHYLGRTGNPDIKTFRWKSGEPSLSPHLNPEYISGPQYATHYTFRVAVIDKNRETLKRIVHQDGLRVLEHERFEASEGTIRN